MVAYSFQKRFVEPILMGWKDQTIRTFRKRHAEVGELMQLYSGMRTKYCRLIATRQCCTAANIHIVFPHATVQPFVRISKPHPDDPDRTATVECWDGGYLDAFAHRDGFKDFDDMARFWRDVHEAREFEGWIGRWRKP